MNKKDDHIRGALSQPPTSNDFDGVRFIHDALAGGSLKDVDLSSTMGGNKFALPIYINAMTGGSDHAEEINRRLAMLARHFNIPMAVGSASTAITHPKWARSFLVVREEYPEGFILSNLGADHDGVAARKAVGLLDADMLQVHLNPIQELIMPEGDRDFSGVFDALRDYEGAVDVPLMVKEVGFGLSREALLKLKDAGIGIVDVSGRGGTNFAAIENARGKHPLDYLEDWGLSTVESLLEASAVEGLEIHASGGIRNPLDAVKAIRLGASMVGMSGYFLRLVTSHPHDESVRAVERFIDGMRRIMAALGAKDLDALKRKPILLSPALRHFVRERS